LSVGSAVTTNATLLHPISPSLELFGTIRNLFDVDRSDPVADSHVQSAIIQDGRTWQVGLRWKLKRE
jgi:hypothetical protein